ncbi:hypothetical protein PWP93_02375 [Paraburkholderia sp. A1RI-2L]|uniref:hypothetical protein n=1 Tax=Paraburkholderia sp. A1RI-2L TaxID=3028367 RepID=UPI003B823CC2
MVTKTAAALPDKIRNNLNNRGMSEGIRAVIKTDFKPNDTIPFIWLVATDQSLLFCCTHKTRGVFKTIPWESISEVRRNGVRDGALSIEIIYVSLDVQTDLLALPPSVSRLELEIFISACSDAMNCG